MSQHLLLVHGHHFKPAADALGQLWHEAMEWALLRDKPEALDEYQQATRSMGYFGDLSNDLLTATGHHYDEALDVADQRNALSSLKQLDKAKRFRRRDYEQLPGRSSLKKKVADITSPLLHSLRMKERVLDKLLPELTAYWQTDSEYQLAVAQRIDLALRAALDSADQVLLLAHGFGSVVAYDALWRLSHSDAALAGKKIDYLLTLGSPLGDETVKQKLSGAGQAGANKFPTNIVSWANLAAADDFVSHDRTLADDYHAMLDLHLVSRINDYRIHNLSVRYGRSNPHSALGYLIHPRLAALLAGWLQR